MDTYLCSRGESGPNMVLLGTLVALKKCLLEMWCLLGG